MVSNVIVQCFMKKYWKQSEATVHTTIARKQKQGSMIRAISRTKQKCYNNILETWLRGARRTLFGFWLRNAPCPSAFQLDKYMLQKSFTVMRAHMNPIELSKKSSWAVFLVLKCLINSSRQQMFVLALILPPEANLALLKFVGRATTVLHLAERLAWKNF